MSERVEHDELGQLRNLPISRSRGRSCGGEKTMEFRCMGMKWFAVHEQFANAFGIEGARSEGL
jgi:hypothetical protein